MDVKIDGKSTGLCPDSCTAIVDTGTYLIYGPRADITGELESLSVSSCNDISKLPELGLDLLSDNGKDIATLTLKPEDYVLKFDVAGGRVDCVMGVGPDDTNKKQWTLGQVFLRAYYTIFDREKDRIGFVRAKDANEVRAELKAEGKKPMRTVEHTAAAPAAPVHPKPAASAAERAARGHKKPQSSDPLNDDSESVGEFHDSR
jgi:hypothetical protein